MLTWNLAWEVWWLTVSCHLGALKTNAITEKKRKAEPGMTCARFGSTYTEIGTLHRSPKGLNANMKLGLPSTVAQWNLSFRRFEDQRKKNFGDVCSRFAWPTWEISIFRTEKNLGYAWRITPVIPGQWNVEPRKQCDHKFETGLDRHSTTRLL